MLARYLTNDINIEQKYYLEVWRTKRNWVIGIKDKNVSTNPYKSMVYTEYMYS